MKKNYNQPIVEATELIVSGQALCTSPVTGITGGSGGTGGSEFPGGGGPIGD